METSVKSNKKRKKKIILGVFAVGAAGILGYFGWQYYNRRKAAKAGIDQDDAWKLPTATPDTMLPADASVTTTATTSRPKTRKETPPSSDNADFPLKKGSKGEKVRQLQEALISKYGKAALPKYGADGDFGSEVAGALKKIGLPATISETTFNVIVRDTNVAANATVLGKALFSATVAKNFNKALEILKKLKDTKDYTEANKVFQSTALLTPGNLIPVRQTIVNGLLNTFTIKSHADSIGYELARIGLQFDGRKWSLSGFDGLAIITIMPTTVWVDAYKGVKVPASMVLGNEVTRRLDYTLFANRGKYFLVPSRCVRYL